MSLRLRIIILVFLAIALAVVINMVRKRILELKYVLVWLLSDIVIALFVLFPSLILGVCKIFGIYSPMNMIFFLGFILSLVIIFTLTVALSKVTNNVRRMSQTIAMLDKELQEFKKEGEKCNGR